MTQPIFPNREPIPEEVRREVLNRAGHSCEDCGCGGSLEIHHLTYLTGREYKDWQELIFGKETADDLVALCRECHKQRHIFWPTGEFYGDIDELNGEYDYFHHVTGKDD